jgi:transcriptional regulator with XRE-family HTH domain
MGITQMTMAERIGVSYQIYQKYEYGTISVSIGRLYDVADVLDVPVSELLAGLADDLPHLKFSKDEHEVLVLFRRIRKKPAVKETLEKLEKFVDEQGEE